MAVHSVNNILYLIFGETVALHADKAVEFYPLKSIRVSRKLIVVNVKFKDRTVFQRREVGQIVPSEIYEAKCLAFGERLDRL